MVTDDPTIDRLVSWAADRDEIRAMLLTSTRAVPGASVDALSDYDVILVVRDVAPFVTDRRWVADFGEVLVAWWDPSNTGADIDNDRYHVGNVIQYTNGLKIDFTLWPVSHLAAMAGGGALPAELEAGYRVLLDRDTIAAALPAPTHTAYRPVQPDAAQWEEAVTGFLVGAPYVAKALLRGDLLPARWCLDCDMIHTYLVPMLHWWVGCAEDWSRPVGNLGKGLQRDLGAETWKEVEAIWTGTYDEALFRAMALFRRVGVRVGDQLEMPYPVEQHDRVEALARSIVDGQRNRPDHWRRA